MKVCIVGAGAIGGFIGARLAATGACSVSALARGATLAALQSHGWRLRQDGRLVQAPVTASDRAEALGPQDLVVIAVQGPALAAVADGLAPLLGPDTAVLPAMNGVPWWFAHGILPPEQVTLSTIDPDGRIARGIPAAHVVGCVVHASTSTPEPGLVQHHMGGGLIIGEPDGTASARVERIAALLAQAGFDVTASRAIRHDIWYKLWGNMTMNPVSAITGATVDRILDDPLVRRFCSDAMDEAARIGRELGCAIDQSAEDRHAVTRKLGVFKSSMLQDAQAGRPLELDAIVAVVRELGQKVGVPTPNIDALFGLARLYGRAHGLYPDVSA